MCLALLRVARIILDLSAGDPASVPAVARLCCGVLEGFLPGHQRREGRQPSDRPDVQNHTDSERCNPLGPQRQMLVDLALEVARQGRPVHVDVYNRCDHKRDTEPYVDSYPLFLVVAPHGPGSVASNATGRGKKQYQPCDRHQHKRKPGENRGKCPQIEGFLDAHILFLRGEVCPLQQCSG